MNRILCGGILLVALSGFAQQGPPYTTPPTFPPDQAPRVSPSPGEKTSQQPQFPPDVAPPQAERPSPAALERSLRGKLAAEPLLNNAKLDVHVTERDITVSGAVSDRRQHDLALQVVQSNAGDRHIVDKIKERG